MQTVLGLACFYNATIATHTFNGQPTKTKGRFAMPVRIVRGSIMTENESGTVLERKSTSHAHSNTVEKATNKRPEAQDTHETCR